MADTPPTLGYGDRNSASIDQVNQWMRAQPWYQQLFQSWGVTPENHPALSDGQKQAIISAAQAHGIVVDEGHNGQTVDDTGNFQPKSNLGRNIAIGAGIAALGLTGLGAAGIGPLSGLLGAGGAAADAGAASAAGGSAAGGAATGLGAAAVPLEAGSFPGITAGLGTAGAAAGGAGAAGAGGAWDAAGNFIGDSTYGGAGGGPSASSILGTVGSIGSALGSAGKGAADARTTEALINQRQDALAQSGYLDQLQGANTDLNQRKFALTAPTTRMSQAAKGDILANAKDFSYGAPTAVGNIPVPSSTGGLRPSIFSPSTKALGALVPQQQLTAQQAGDQFAPLPTPPILTPLPSPGVGSGILNTAGTVGNLANLLKNVPGAASWLGSAF